MAARMPVPSWGVLTSLRLAGAGLCAARNTRVRPLAVGHLALTLFAWCALAVLSVASSLQ